MTPARLPAHEAERLRALQQLHILDTPPEESFDDIVQLAVQLCDVPTAIISLVDADRQWFKARVGMELCQTSRDVAFCSHAILEDGIFVVPDASQDPRFLDNPLVTGKPGIRFYAGVPLRNDTGLPLGVLCLNDSRPRELTPEQRTALLRLGRQASRQLELRRIAGELALQREALAASESGLRALLADLPAAVIQSDPRGRCTMVNARWTELTGHGVAEALGSGWLRVIHAEDRIRVAREWTEAARSAGAFRSEYRYVLPNGAVRWVEGRAVPRHAPEGSVIGLIGTAIDITDRREAEEARRGSEQRLERTVEATRDGVWDWDIPSGSVYYSPRWCRMLGFEPNEVEPRVRAWESLLHPEDAPAVLAAVQANQRGESDYYQVEMRLRTRDGRWRWIRARGNVVERDKEGHPLRMIGTHTDITHEREAEADLRASEDRFRRLADQAPVMIWMTDAAGEYTYANVRRLAFSGDTIESLRAGGRGHIHPEDANETIATYDRALRERSPFSMEYRSRRQDGEYRLILATGAPWYQGDGSFAGFVGTSSDVTEARRTAELVEHERFVLGQTITNAPIAMAMLDTEMRYIAYSRKWLEDYGLAGQELTGRSHYEVFPGLPERWLALHQRALAGEALSDPEDTFLQPNGERAFLRWAIHPWRQSGGAIGGIIMVTDVVTDLVRARQEAIESARLKADFLASMSHEIRTPMNGVIGMTGLLLDTPLSSEQRECAETIRASSEALLTIINDILDLSKIEADKLVIEPVPFDLHRVVEDVSDLLVPRIQDKRLELAVRYAPDVPRRVVGDPGRLRQILTNLVGNAVKFTERGHILVEVTTEGAPATPSLRFEVRDTGIGIPADKLSYVFEKFIQADSSTTRKFGGTGLGLAISRQLARLMGGTIGVQSELGVGSTFWFTLPFPAVQGDAAGIAEEERLPADRRVLIVDDVALTGRIMSEQIAYLGAGADTVDSGAAALERLRQAAETGRRYDAVVIDFMMPEMDGEGLARAIAADPALAGNRLILASGMMSRPREEWLRELDFLAFLRKPVRLEDLLPTLRSAFAPADTGAATQRPVPGSSEAAPEAEAAAAAPRATGARVLVVDDNSVNQKVAARMLTRLGCRVDVAANGREAVELVRKLPYAMIFMDCMMPEMDGYEATAAIRAMPGPVSRTPIIAMTANAMQGDREHCLAAGMDDYFSKPVRQEQLQEALTRWAQEPAAPSAVPPIDSGVLEGFRQLQEEGEPDVVHEFIDLFMADLPARREAILLALRDGEPERLRAAAHALKSSAAYIGAAELARLCKEVELAARAGDLVAASRRCAALETEADRAAAYLLARRSTPA